MIFWHGLIIGLIIGANVGLLVFAVIKAGKNYICDVKDGEFVFTEKTA